MITRELGPLRFDLDPQGDERGLLTVERAGEPLLIDDIKVTSRRRRTEVVGLVIDACEEDGPNRDEIEEVLRQLTSDFLALRNAGAVAEDLLSGSAREIVHPSFHLCERFLLYGFRIEHVRPDGSVDKVPMWLMSVAQEDGVQVVPLADNLFELDDQTYFIRGNWNPPLLDGVWSREGVTRLVSGEHEPLSPNKIYEHLKRILHRHVDFLDAGAYPILAAFVLLTYLHRTFPAVPYIGVMGPKGTGKSATLGTLERLCFNAYKGRVTAASLGDTCAALRGTILVDQAECLSEKLLDLLVDGYRRDGGRRRIVDMDNRGSPLEFETFGPKVFATAEGIDPDLEDRLIVIPSSPATRPIQPLPASDHEFQKLRGELYATALHHWPQFVAVAEELERSDVNSRKEELWAPIDRVLSLCEASASDRREARALYRRSAAQTIAELTDGEVAILDELRSRAQATEEEQFELRNSELFRSVCRRIGGEPEKLGLTKQWLGSALDNLGILEGKDRRSEGGTRSRFYQFNRQRILAQAQRYSLLIGDTEQPETNADRPTREASTSSGSSEPRHSKEERGPARVPAYLVEGSLTRHRAS